MHKFLSALLLTTLLLAGIASARTFGAEGASCKKARCHHVTISTSVGTTTTTAVTTSPTSPTTTGSTGMIKYASLSGNDTTGAGTFASPWRTIQKLVTNLGPGDEGHILGGGTFVGNVTFAAGGTSEGTRVKLMTEPGNARATIKGIVYQPPTVNYITISDIRFEAPATTGTMMQMFGDYPFVTNCELDGLNQNIIGIVLGFQRATQGAEISYSKIHNFGPGPTSGGVFVHGIYIDMAQNYKIHDNFIYDNFGGYGIHLWEHPQNGHIYNNTLDGNGAGNIIISGVLNTRGAPASNNEIDHNILSNPASINGSANTRIFWGDFSSSVANAGTGNTVHDNIYYNGSLDPGTAYGTHVGVTYTNNINANPQYVDRPNKDFRLQTGSPAAGYGAGAVVGGGGGGGGTGNPVGYVDQAGVTNDASATTVTTTIPSLTVGDVLVVAVSNASGGGGTQTVTVTDNLGNTYTLQRQQYDSPDSQFLTVFTCKATVGSGSTVTITATFDVARSFRRIGYVRLRDPDPTTYIDAVEMNAVATAPTSANGVVGPSLTSTRSGDRVIGIVMDTSGVPAIAPGTGFTERVDVGGLEIEELSQGAAGAIAPTWTFTAAHQFIAATVLVKASLATARDFFIKAGGSDAADGLSDATAWATAGKVATFIATPANVQPGDKFNFKGGDTFTVSAAITTSEDGTLASPVIMRSYGTGKATLQAGAGFASSIFSIGHDYITIQNLIIQGNGRDVTTANHSGITLGSACLGCNIIDCEILNFPNLGISNNGDSTFINNCLIHGIGGIGILAGNSGDDCEIQGTTVYNCGYNSTYQTGSRHGIALQSKNGKVHGCDISDCVGGDSIQLRKKAQRVWGNSIHDTAQAMGFKNYDPDSISVAAPGFSYVYGNKCWNISTYIFNYDSAAPDASVGGPGTMQSTVDIVFANNTCHMTSGDGFTMTANPDAGMIIANNVLFGSPTLRYLKLVAPTRTGKSLIEKNNLFYGSSATSPWMWNGNQYTTLAAYKTASSLGQFDMVTNPLITSAPAFLPQAGSPVIDTGTTSVETGIQYTSV